MAARLNTRFILILVVAAVVLVGGGIAGYMVVNKTGEDWVQAARQAEEAGDWEAAIRYWERAVGHEHGNVEWLRGWRAAYKHIVPENKQEAMESYQELRSINGAIASARPDDPEIQEEWFQGQMDNFRRVGSDTQSWISFADTVDETLKYIGDPLERGYEADSPEELEYARLLRFRAIAQLEQMRRVEVSPALRTQVREDLERCLRSLPDDVRIATGLAEWHLLEAQRMLTQRRLAESQEQWERSTEVLEEFVEENPNDPQALINLAVRNQQSFRQQVAQATSAEEARQMQAEARQTSLAYLDRAAEALRSNPDQAAILSLSMPRGMLMMLDPRNGLERALELVDRGLSEDKKNTTLLFRKAELLRGAGRFDEAIAVLDRIVELPTPTAGLDAYAIFLERPHAVLQQFNTVMEQWRRTADATEQAEALRRAESFREEYLQYVTSAEEDPSMWLMDGQLAHAKENNAEAIRLLQRARTALGGFDSHLKYVLADALRERGQLGDAEDLLSQAFREMPPFDPLWPAVFSNLINLQQQLNMGEAACNTIEEVLRVYPAETDLAKQLMALHQNLARQHDLTDRLGMYDVQVDPKQEAIQQIREAFRDGSRSEELEPMINQLVAQYPGDAEALELRARLYESGGESQKSKALAAWRDVLAVQPNHDLAQTRVRILEGADPLAIAEERIRENEELSEIERQLRLWRLYSDAGLADRAAEALDRAAELAPENPDVVEIRFVTALNKQQWETAWEMVNLAREENLDQANGDLFEGRLHHAQDDPQAAITQFTRALEQNPLLAEGYWLRARAHYDTGNLKACIADLERAYASRPNDLRIVKMLAQALRQRDEDAEALEIVRAAHDRAPRDAELTAIWRELERSVGDTEEVTKDLRQRYEANPEDVTSVRQYAAHLIQEEEFAEAERVLDDLQRLAPEQLFTLNLRAAWHAAQGGPDNIDAGRDVYAEYIRSADPQELTSAPYLALSNYLVEHGREGEAVQWLERGLDKQDPETREIEITLATVYFQVERFEQAAEHFEAALDQATGLSDEQVEYVILRLIESKIELGQTQEANRLLQRHMSGAEARPEHYLLEARIHQIAGDTAKARQALDKAVATDPNNHFSYYRRAQFNRTDPAMRNDVLADLSRSLEIMPGFRPARELRILVLYEDGQLEQAVEEQGNLLDLFPKDRDLRKSYAENLKSLGRDEEQLQVLVEGTEIFPDEPQWHSLIASWQLSHDDVGGAQRSMRQAYEISERDPRMGLLFADVLLREGPQADAELANHILERHAEQLRPYPDYHLLQARAAKQMGRLREVPAAMKRAWEISLRAGMPRNDAGQRWANTLMELFPPPALDGMLQMVQEVIGEDVPAVVYLTIAQDIGDYNIQGMDPRLIALLEPLVDDEEHPLRARVTAAMFMGELHHRQGQREQTVEIYERVLNEILPPPEADGADVHRLARLQCLNNLAYILAKELGKPEQALPYAERAAEMRPNDADVLDTYGLVLLRLDRLEDADRELSKSLAVEEKTPNLLHMAEVKMKLGLLEEARTYLNKAQVKIAPHEADYQEYMQRLRQELLDLEAGN